MYRTEPHPHLYHNEHDNLTIDQSVLTFSNQFDWSIHNCLCRRAKTGLILYPKDIQLKNVILLVCEECFNYQLENGSAYRQLEEWYFNIYKDSKSFHFKSRFLQNEDGSFCFYGVSLNSNELFHIRERELEHWEKEAIERTIRRKQR